MNFQVLYSFTEAGLPCVIPNVSCQDAFWRSPANPGTKQAAKACGSQRLSFNLERSLRPREAAWREHPLFANSRD